MTIGQVEKAFKGLYNEPCPLTEKLIKSGYQQSNTGYISVAKQMGLKVDYKKALPTQKWHFIQYIEGNDSNKEWSKSIQCGELLFWMAEVSHIIPHNSLVTLLYQIKDNKVGEKGGKPYYNRKFWNKRIQDIVYPKLIKYVEVYS